MPNNTQPRQVTLWQEQAAKLSGLTFGGVDTDGVQWVLTDISGFYDIDLEGETGARAWRDGDWVAQQFADRVFLKQRFGLALSKDAALLQKQAVVKIRCDFFGVMGDIDNRCLFEIG